MPTGEIIELRKEITTKRGWFQAFAFWPKISVVEVYARQILENRDCGEAAEVTISEKGKTVFRQYIPWVILRGRAYLLLQVYLLSQEPGRSYSYWQKVMEDFCFSFPDFKPPLRVTWSKEPLLG